MIFYFFLFISVTALIIVFSLKKKQHITDVYTDLLSEVKMEKDVYITNAFYDYRIKSFRLFYYSPVNFSNYSCYFEYNQGKKRCRYYYKPYRTFNTPYGHLIIPLRKNAFPKNIILNETRIKANVPIERKNKFKLTVCFITMVNYTAVNRLIQTIESYRRFGADHFTIYYTSSSKNVMKILKYYQSMNLLELVKGTVEIETDDFGKKMYYGQLGKGDDCIYRNMKQSKRVAVVDLDEIMWPIKSNTIVEMLDSFKEYNAFSFRSYHFYTEIINNSDLRVHNISDLNIFNYRKYCRYKPGYVVKNIYGNLSAVNSIFVHWAVDYTKEYKEIDIPYQIGYIRHTRRLMKEAEGNCETGALVMEKDRREDEINIATKRIRKIVNT